MSMSDLASMLGIERSNASTLVNEFEDQGFMVRKADPEDRRKRELLRGFVNGYPKIHHGETRHIAYGVGFLLESVRQEPRSGPGSNQENAPSAVAAGWGCSVVSGQ